MLRDIVGHFSGELACDSVGLQLSIFASSLAFHWPHRAGGLLSARSNDLMTGVLTFWESNVTDTDMMSTFECPIEAADENKLPVMLNCC